MRHPLSRRLLLRHAAGLGLAGVSLGARPALARATGEVAEGEPLAADPLRVRLNACRPEGDPLAALLEGNRRFAAVWHSGMGDLSPRERMARLAELWRNGCQTDPAALAEGQRPWAAVLACADSRVSPEWVFDVGPGALFDVRSAGNTAFSEGIASLEYAVEELGVQLLVVMGHSGCGAVQAAMADRPLTPLLRELVTPIRDCLRPGMDLQSAVEANARATASALTQRSALLATAVQAGQLRIAAAVLDLGSGRVRLL